MKLILASTSPRRAEILRHAGFAFSVVSSAVDETPGKNESPDELVRRLAAVKADLVAARAVGPAIVIAADTVVVADSKILGKPRDSDDARRMLARLSHRVHSVITGVSLIRLPDGQRLEVVDRTDVQFAELSNQEIERYVATKEPFDKAGAYAIQGRAGRYIPKISGCYFNVMGLPLAKVTEALGTLGWAES